MATALGGLAGRSDRPSRAIATALRTTAAGRTPHDERPWLERIDRRRGEVAGLSGRRTPDQMGVFDVVRAVRWMSVPPVLGRLLIRLVRELAPDSCLELGTGFGISGAYQAAALELNRRGRLFTIDADPRPAAIASEGFAALGLAERVEVRAGAPEATLAEVLEEITPVDFAFIDADHRDRATVAAFEQLLPHLSPGAVVVFDDLGLSWAGMRRAWRAIAGHEGVALARHLGRFGLTVIR